MLDVLRVLTTVGDISEEAWAERFEWMRGRGDYYVIVISVVEGEGSSAKEKIVGTGAVVVERKL